MRSGRGWLGIGLALTLGLALASSARAGGESPVLGKLVGAGKLPPLAQRLPERPRVIATDPEAVYGGDLRMLIGTLKDTKLAFVYGYARLVGFDRNYRLVPDIVERYEVEDGGRTFTFYLRKGHRWSDGAPFTSADFAYWWNQRRERRRALARRPARDPPSRRRDAEGDLPRPDDGAVSLVQAQQPVPHRPGGRVPDHHLPPGALPEAVPQGLQHRGCAEEARARRGAPQLGGPPQQERRDVPDGQPRHAHAPALAPHRRAAGAGLRVRAESLLPPGGRAGPAASLHRPARHDAGGAGRHSGEDVDGRGRPPGAVYLLRPGPVPPEERAASRVPRLPLEHRGPLHRGHLPESDDERSGHAPDPPGPALPPGAVAGREPAGDQPHPLLRPRAARAEHGAPEPGRPRGAPERLRAVRPPAGQPAPRRDGPDERGTAAASGSARTGSGSISSWRRPARRRSTRTCWSS